MKKDKEVKDAKEKKVSEKGRLYINVIDVLIIVLVLACIAGVTVRFTVLDDIWTTRNLENYEITFVSSSLTYAQCNAIADAVKDAENGSGWVYFVDSNTKFGDLKMTNEFKQDRETVIFKGADGSIISAVYDENEPDEEVRWTVTGTIQCLGKLTAENGFLLNGKQYIAPNSQMDVMTWNCDFTMKVVRIAPVTE